MDVDTGETTYRSDPSVTGVVPASAGAGQGRLFHDPTAAPSFPDTDQLPVVSRRDGGARPYGAPRWLRGLVAVVVVAIVAAGAALALVESGVIGRTTSPPVGGHTRTTTAPTVANTAQVLLTPAQTFAGPQSASYTIAARAFAVTVTAGPGISWVSIGVVGQNPIYAGILQPNTSQHEILLGPAQVSIGAGGTKVTVTSGRHSQTLLPPSAPFTYQITPKD
ncbi:MAG TPA: hypothetical protein VG346_02625 [Acidimicrobiales bacterium]|jgi:hypothetical protein|nr:hypothetical protein [Acidimicrobiales bacterium]